MQKTKLDRLFWVRKYKNGMSEYTLEKKEGSIPSIINSKWTRNVILKGLMLKDVEKVTSSKEVVWYHFKEGYTRKTCLNRIFTSRRYQVPPYVKK